jgi:hypothetical protein
MAHLIAGWNQNVSCTFPVAYIGNTFTALDYDIFQPQFTRQVKKLTELPGSRLEDEFLAW